MTPKLGSFRGLLIFTVVVIIAEKVITYGYVVGTGNVLKFLNDHGIRMTARMEKLTESEWQTIFAFSTVLSAFILCIWPILAEAQKRRGFLIPWAILLMLNTLFYVLHFVGSIVKGEGLQVLRNGLYLAFVVLTLVVTFYRYKELKMESGSRRGPEMEAMGGVPVMFVNKK